MKEAHDGFPMDISYYQWTLDNTPRLRKNRRVEDKWGLKYCAAVKEAIFSERNFPYTPPKPPQFSTDSDAFCEKLHTCGQCRDSFQFESSLKDHHARRSWILGLWCQHCFITVCSHTTPNKPPCASCINLDRHKRTYLREKSSKKTLKYGVARVFYNPCQFFDHLSIHSAREVNMSDIMLMPLPSNIDHEWSTELHRACEALMENAFLSDVHISDWLKDQNIETNWWKFIKTDEIDEENHMTEILKNFRNHDLFGISPNTSKRPSRDKSLIKIQSLSNKKDIVVGKQNGTLVHIDGDAIESEDNPCLMNDITFVDCGPTPKCFESEPLALAISRKRNTIYVTSDTSATKETQPSNYLVKGKLQPNKADIPTKNVPSKSISPPQLKDNADITIKEIKKSQPLDDKPKSKEGNTTPDEMSSQPTGTKKLPLLLPKLVRATKKLKTSDQSMKVVQQSVPPPVVNVNSKILTLQSSKNVDLTTLISQLSPHLNNSKILLIDESSDGMVVASQNLQKPQSTIDLMQINDKNQHIIKTVPMKILSVNSPSNDSSNEMESSKSNVQQGMSLENKIIYQNGRKYIIKPTSSNSSPQNPPVTLTVKKSQTEQRSSTNSETVSFLESKNKLLNSSEVSLTETSIFPRFTPSIPALTKALSPAVRLSPIPKTKSQLGSKETKPQPSSEDETMSPKIGPNLSFNCLKFLMKEDKKLYLRSTTTQVENSNPIHSNAMIPTCRYEMLNEFYQLKIEEIQKRIDHLQKLNTDFARVMYFGSDSIVNENRKVIKLLQHEVLCASASRTESEDGNKSIDDTDEILNNWELDLLQINERPKCTLCNKVFKPNSYIPGFSKPAEKDNVYCLCYKYICHLCYTYHGNNEDFMFHHNVHKKKEPSQCPDCSEQFTSFKSLEIHLWTECFHMLKKQFFGCRICQVDGFLDMEAVTRHFSIMHGYRKVACEKCNLVLSTFADYEQHCHDKHSTLSSSNPTRLVFCKLDQSVIRCEDYMSHLENHVGVRKLTWYKCPFCRFFSAEMDRNRVFLKPHLHSKHYSRLPEIINIEYLRDIVPGKKFHTLSATTSSNMARFKNNTTHYKDGIVVPRIVNARTITSEVFERGTQDIVDSSIETKQKDTILSEIEISVKPSKSASTDEIKVPKILEVRSMAEAVKKKKHPKAKKPETIIENLFQKAHKSIQYEVGTKRKKFMIDISEGSSDSMDANDLDYLSDPPNTRDVCEKPLKNVTLTKIYRKKINKNNDDSFENSQMGSTFQPDETSTPKLPPLSRIPQRVDEISPSREIEEQTWLRLNPVEEDMNAETEKIYSKSLNRKRRWRVALNEPTTSSAEEDCQHYLCHTCGELINTSWSTISAHYKTKHSHDYKLSSVTPRLLRISPDFINGGYKDIYNKKKKLETSMTTATKRRRRWGPKKYTDPNNSSLGLCIKQESAEDGQGLFKCKKCDQRCSDMSNLREHIAINHRIKDRYLICLECGENFVVAPSLQMHLKAFHGIKDPNAYLLQNPSYVPDIKNDCENESKTVVANQCSVCMAVFVDKAAVDKHLRVHGMAFLNRKRIEAQNALKNSKKTPTISKESNHHISKETTKIDNVPQSIVDKVNMAT